MTENKVDIELLETEYFHLQSEIERGDAKSLTIKAWSVSLAGAIAGSSAFTDNIIIVLFAALVSLMFWFIDAIWKTFQFANYRRIDEIEAFMRGELNEIDNLQMSASWGVSFRERRRSLLFTLMFAPHVIIPHGAMFVLLLILYLVLAYG